MNEGRQWLGKEVVVNCFKNLSYCIPRNVAKVRTWNVHNYFLDSNCRAVLLTVDLI